MDGTAVLGSTVASARMSRSLDSAQRVLLAFTGGTVLSACSSAIFWSRSRAGGCSASSI